MFKNWLQKIIKFFQTPPVHHEEWDEPPLKIEVDPVARERIKHNVLAAVRQDRKLQEAKTTRLTLPEPFKPTHVTWQWQDPNKSYMYQSITKPISYDNGPMDSVRTVDVLALAAAEKHQQALDDWLLPIMEAFMPELHVEDLHDRFKGWKAMQDQGYIVEINTGPLIDHTVTTIYTLKHHDVQKSQLKVNTNFITVPHGNTPY